ncbi:MAG: SdpI family protein [Steroidobacteraceae bacterium]
MTILRRYWLAIAFVGGSFCVSAIGYDWLPPRVAVHWNLAGQANGWMARPIGAFILPLIGLVLTAILIAVAPKASARIQPDTIPKAYAKVVAAIAALLLYATISVVAVAVGLELNVPEYAAVGAGVLLAILGNALGKTRRNSLIGVRTPWTLRSDEVWLRTNRFAGRLLILGGAVTIVGALVGWGIFVLLCVVAATAIIATVHSYSTAKHLRGDS